jgi:hypothetical protein
LSTSELNPRPSWNEGRTKQLMLMWTTLGRPDGTHSFGLIVHHTDAEREFAYDRQHVLSGQLDKGLDEAAGHGWVLVDMMQDWKVVFPNSARAAPENS